LNRSGDDLRRGGVERIYAGYARSPRRRRAWAAANPGNRAIREEVAARALTRAAGALAGPGPVLDVGCGTGWWLACLAHAGVAPERLHGVDLLPIRVAAARDAVVGARVEVGDACALHFDDATFALVTLFTVCSSLGSRDAVTRAVREARRVLRPGGLLLIWEPRIANPRNRATRVVGSRQVSTALGGPVRCESVTLLPALSRRLERSAPRTYPLLVAVPLLRTHRLMSWERP